MPPSAPAQQAPSGIWLLCQDTPSPEGSPKFAFCKTTAGFASPVRALRLDVTAQQDSDAAAEELQLERLTSGDGPFATAGNVASVMTYVLNSLCGKWVAMLKPVVSCYTSPTAKLGQCMQMP